VPEISTYHKVFNFLHDGRHVAKGEVIFNPLSWMNELSFIKLTLSLLTGIVLSIQSPSLCFPPLKKVGEVMLLI